MNHSRNDPSCTCSARTDSGVPTVSACMIQGPARAPTSAIAPTTTTPRVASTEPSRRAPACGSPPSALAACAPDPSSSTKLGTSTENSSPPTNSSKRTFETSLARW